jgi:hypothetical protein
LFRNGKVETHRRVAVGCASGLKSNEKVWVKRICSRTPGGSVSSSNGQALISSSPTSGPSTARHRMSRSNIAGGAVPGAETTNDYSFS